MQVLFPVINTSSGLSQYDRLQPVGRACVVVHGYISVCMYACVNKYYLSDGLGYFINVRCQ